MPTDDEVNLDNDQSNKAWFDDYADEEQEDFQIDEYDLTATPNDFNVLTIFSFIESGSVKIPGFQRNYVWDIARASKLIESLLLGLPVPQVFLYEETRNKFLVIDGQQRLMSIYYFIKQRFPRKEKRVELRGTFDKYGKIPDDLLENDAYFTNFNLSLPEKLPAQRNRFKGLNYSTLGDHKTQFDLRPIRNIIVKQNVPKDDDSSIYEIFNRLNSGGINLRPQEIRTSLYHSPFYDMLYRINMLEKTRKLLHMEEPDLHMKDVEILLRGFAMLVDGDNYRPSMIRFLNQFSRKRKSAAEADNRYLEALFESFLSACDRLPDDAFINKGNRRFNIALYEAAFTAACEERFNTRELLQSKLDPQKIKELSEDPEFLSASQKATTGRDNVFKRLQRGRDIIGHS
jgi:uncharacterized protein with ParB-like and HNH nuclease domain